MDSTLALQALAAIIADEDLRGRFLALTGYDGDTIRARAGSADMVEAVAGFLGGHEPDLILVAERLDIPPARLLEGRA